MTSYVFKRDTWVIVPKTIPSPKLRLFCLPFAGGNANAFREWANFLPDTVELNAVEIPGRGHRLAEPLVKQIEPLVEAIAQGIKPYLDRPFTLFGHSMGALLGFELTHYLKQEFDLQPAHLFLSGRGAPDIVDKEEPIHNLPENEFIERIKNYNGTPKEVLEHEELMQIMIPILRSDFEVCETYRYQEKPKLTLPLTVFGGLKDSSAPSADLEAWANYTEGPFALRMFSGDHFYLLQSKADLVHAILRDINKYNKLL